jgi:D-alanine-D-alanine ligase-like ATP-grasp enzyme
METLKNINYSTEKHINFWFNTKEQVNNVLQDKFPFAPKLLFKLAPKIWAKVILEQEYWYIWQIIYQNWKKVFFKNTNFDLNPLCSVEIAKDKWYAKYFLQQNWYSVPKWQTFFSDERNKHLEIKRNIDDWYKYIIENFWFPLIIKPNDLSQWVWVNKIYSKEEYYEQAKKIFEISRVMIIEEFQEWNDYRIVVLDDDIISAYQRIPLNVVWDWKSSIQDLLLQKQQEFYEIWRKEKIDFLDDKIEFILKRNWLNLSSVLPKWQKISLLDNANLSTWWDSKDITKEIHKEFQELAIKVTKDMWLRLCGVDIIAEDITKSLQKYSIIEINWAPWLDNYTSLWKEQIKIVEDLYLKILIAMWK